MRAQIAIRRGGFVNPGAPDLKQALRPVPSYERAVREVSRMLAAAGIRHAPAGALAANVVMKLLAGRTQDLADIEAIAGSGVDRDSLRAAVRRLVPDRAATIERLFER